MNLEEFWKFLNSEVTERFVNIFGGRFAYAFEYEYVYIYDRTAYYLPENFQTLVNESIEKNENLFLKLEKVEEEFD